MGQDEGGERERLKEFERKQAFELAEFEAAEKRRLEEFESHERREREEFERRENHPFDIKIDRTEYKVQERKLNGAQLRALPRPPIGPDRDVFEVVPGGSDRKIEASTEIRMHDGLRFFTAPAQINPGRA